VYDRCGKVVVVGQTTDIMLQGIFQGVITDVHEVPLAVSQTKVAPPQVVIQILLKHVPADGVNAGFYIIAEPEEEKKSLIM